MCGGNGERPWQTSHHLPVHGDDVADEGAVLGGGDVSVGHPVGQGHLRAAGHQGAGPTVGDEDWLDVHVAVSSRSIGYRCDV